MLTQAELLICTLLEGAGLFLQTTAFPPESLRISGLCWELVCLGGCVKMPSWGLSFHWLPCPGLGYRRPQESHRKVAQWAWNWAWWAGGISSRSW